MRNYPFSVAVGAQTPVSVVGTYIRYYSNSAGAANPTLIIKTDKGDSVQLAPNESVRLARRFSGLIIANRDGIATIAGVLLVGEGDMSQQTFSGSVSVTALPGLAVDNTDGQAPVGAAGILPELARLEAWNGAAFDRLRALADNADAQAPAALGALLALARLQGWNGSSWDRLRADSIGGAGALRTTHRGFAYGASYQSSTTIGAGSTDTVFAPASNLNGAIVWEAEAFDQQNTSAGNLTLLAKSALPTTAVDGDMQMLAAAQAINPTGTVYFNKGQIVAAPRLIPAGKGLYFWATVAESAALRRVLYTLL